MNETKINYGIIGLTIVSVVAMVFVATQNFGAEARLEREKERLEAQARTASSVSDGTTSGSDSATSIANPFTKAQLDAMLEKAKADKPDTKKDMNDDPKGTIAGTTMELPGGLKLIDTVKGTGAVAKAGDKVTVHYVGKLHGTETVFDSSVKRGTPFVFTLGAGQVIKGWDQGVAGMAEGSTRTLIIPPSLGYGSQPAGSIPPNSTLEFVVQMLKVE